MTNEEFENLKQDIEVPEEKWEGDDDFVSGIFGDLLDIELSYWKEDLLEAEESMKEFVERYGQEKYVQGYRDALAATTPNKEGDK